MLNIVKSRVDPLIEPCRNKNVLDFGCCGMGTNDTLGGSDFHFGRIREVSKEVIGIDINLTEIERLTKLGYNIVPQSADEPFDLKRKFDVVLAEEVIEHLSDLRIFLNNVKKHMRPDSLFIVTSPSPFSWAYQLQRWFFGKELTNDYHTHWHSEKTMCYLLKSNGFDVMKYEVIDAMPLTTRGKIGQTLLFWLPKRFGTNVIYYAKLNSGN